MLNKVQDIEKHSSQENKLLEQIYGNNLINEISNQIYNFDKNVNNVIDDENNNPIRKKHTISDFFSNLFGSKYDRL